MNWWGLLKESLERPLAVCLLFVFVLSGLTHCPQTLHVRTPCSDQSQSAFDGSVIKSRLLFFLQINITFRLIWLLFFVFCRVLLMCPLSVKPSCGTEEAGTSM